MSGFLCDIEFLQALPIIGKMEEIIIQRDFEKNKFWKSTSTLMYKIIILLQEYKKQFQRFCSHSDGEVVLFNFNSVWFNLVQFCSHQQCSLPRRVFLHVFFLTFLLSCRRGRGRVCMEFMIFDILFYFMYVWSVTHFTRDDEATKKHLSIGKNDRSIFQASFS